MHLEAGWKIVGVVTESRELKSQKNATWRGYVAKVASLGLSVEVQLTPEQFKQIVEGQHLEMRGRFEERGGELRLVCVSHGPAGKAGAA